MVPVHAWLHPPDTYLFTLFLGAQALCVDPGAAGRRAWALAEAIPPLLLFGAAAEPPFWATGGIVSPNREQVP